MANGTAESTEHVLTTLETAFTPLEAKTTLLDNGNVQLRILSGSEAILIDERPLHGLGTQPNLHGWIEDSRARLEEMGYQLEPEEAPAHQAR